jgi:addiction module HigA family antidote
MKNPSHPGRILRSGYLEPLDLSVTRAAEILGVTRQALNNVVSGRSAVSAEMAVRLAKAFGTSAKLWLCLQGAYDLAQVEKSRIKVQRLRKVAKQRKRGHREIPQPDEELVIA